jgi:purine nucleosidase
VVVIVYATSVLDLPATPMSDAKRQKLDVKATQRGTRVIIDTDPGVDDALAILLALGAQNMAVEGLTIVCGNGKDIRKLGANAKLLARCAGFAELPVSLGEAPLDDGEAAQDIPVHVHGRDGLGDVAEALGRTDADFTDFHTKPAAQFIVDACAASPGEITLVAIGPLSNVAAALALRPDLPQLARELVVMGGAVHGELRGNRTCAAEANFVGDPEAAQAVLTAGFRNVILADLGATHQTDMGALRDACCEELPGNEAAKLVHAVSACFIDCYLHTFRATHAPAHDVVAVMYLVKPELFTTRDARIEVETTGTLTRGMSVADWTGRWKKPMNCKVIMTVNVKPFVDEFVAAMRRLPRAVLNASGSADAK